MRERQLREAELRELRAAEERKRRALDEGSKHIHPIQTIHPTHPIADTRYSQVLEARAPK